MGTIILAGYTLNVLAMVTYIAWAVHLKAELGSKTYEALMKSSPRFTKWILVLWLIPFIGVYSLCVNVYKWNAIQAQNLVERLDKFLNRPRGPLSNLFVIHKDKDLYEGAEVGV